MKMHRIPCPIPYQGSKRGLAFKILSYFPPHISGRLIEPFAGSAAISLAAAMTNRASQFIIADILAPLIEIWKLILENPEQLASEYERLWYSQLDDPKYTYFRIRDEFNIDHNPIKLLYLIVRCAKNAVRFNSEGQFNQSPDNRRLGMRPEKMRQEIFNAHRLLSGRTIALAADYREVLRLAEPDDLVYMDPPYQGVSSIGNPRYVQQLDLDMFIRELELLNKRNIPYLVSFDGACGGRTYGQELPPHLKFKRILLPAGRSSQATLLGREALTIESLYLSPALVERITLENGFSFQQLSISDLRP
ncbi:MAG: DNA adenine methylase [Peptococcaceae bacterium]|nr:DNA adenine methylase [Peptococcaceae bacterium]